MPEKELTLGDILRLLLKRWKVLGLLFAVTTGAIFGVTWFLLDDMYCGEAVLLVMSSKLRSKQMAQDYLGLSLESYIRLVDNKQVVVNLFERLGQHKESHPDSPIPETMRLKDFRRRIRVEEVRNSECIRIQVFLEEPQLAKEFANELAKQAETRNFQLLGADTSDSVSYMSRKVQSSSVELETMLEELVRFKQKANLEELNQEIDVAFGLQESWKVEKVYLEISIRETREKLRALDAEKNIYPERKTLKRNITESPELAESLRKMPSDVPIDSILELGLDVEILNPVYSTIEAGISEASVELSIKQEKLTDLTMRLESIEKRLDGLLAEKHQKERILEELDIKKGLAKQQFERYMTWQSEVDAVVASERQDLRLIDEAIVPEKPTGPKRLFIALTAGVMVMMVGFFAFLARDIYRMI